MVSRSPRSARRSRSGVVERCAACRQGLGRIGRVDATASDSRGGSAVDDRLHELGRRRDGAAGRMLAASSTYSSTPSA